MVWLEILGALFALGCVMAAFRPPRRVDVKDLGSLSQSWINNHRVDVG